MKRIDEVVPRPRRDWQADAECLGTDTDVFFPNGRLPFNGPHVVYCGPCPVRFDCLAAAMLNREQFGIWGGFEVKPRERLERRLRRGTVTWVEITVSRLDRHPRDVASSG